MKLMVMAIHFVSNVHRFTIIDLKVTLHFTITYQLILILMMIIIIRKVNLLLKMLDDEIYQQLIIDIIGFSYIFTILQSKFAFLTHLIPYIVSFTNWKVPILLILLYPIKLESNLMKSHSTTMIEELIYSNLNSPNYLTLLDFVLHQPQPKS